MAWHSQMRPNIEPCSICYMHRASFRISFKSLSKSDSLIGHLLAKNFIWTGKSCNDQRESIEEASLPLGPIYSIAVINASKSKPMGYILKHKGAQVEQFGHMSQSQHVYFK